MIERIFLEDTHRSARARAHTHTHTYFVILSRIRPGGLIRVSLIMNALSASEYNENQISNTRVDQKILRIFVWEKNFYYLQVKH
jgi:hypothetical protein